MNVGDVISKLADDIKNDGVINSKEDRSVG